MWPFGKNRKAPSGKRSIPAVVRARFDAAQTTAENARHWAMADAMSADGAGSADVRRKLRQRSRYEVANNSYAKGIVLTIANDCIGTGPRLQLLADDGQINRQIETAFAEWSEAVNLAAKLRTMRMAKSTDGETFAVLTANPMIDSPVKLDVQLVEADRVASPLTVVPKAVEISAASRITSQHDVQIDIGIQKKLGKDLDAEVPVLCELVDEIAAFLKRRPLQATPHAVWVRSANEPIYAPEHLAEQRVFTSILTVTYRAMG